jgi:tetratricopeptide (TPR) repeat protein
MMRRALKAYEREEPDGFQVALTLGNLGGALIETGDLDEALDCYARALVIKRALLSPDHPSLAFTLGGQGEALLALGRPKQALAPLREALEIRMGAKVDPLYLASSQFSVAKALRAASGDPAEADALAREALGAFRQAGESAAEELAEVQAWLDVRG